MNYLEILNESQYNAVTSVEGPSLVIAGAGSGKTRVLTMRIAYLLEQGVKPYNIFALTFTNKAAREMRERITNIVGEQIASQLYMGTFHSLFARILRYEAQYLGFNSDFTIYDTQDSKSLIKNIIKTKKLDDKIYKPATILSNISAAKNNLVTPAAYMNNVNYTARDKSAQRPLTGQIYSQYVNECRRCNALDFDDLLLYTNVLFRDHQDVLEKYQNKFKYVLVDEYQDTNLSQYIIIKRLVAQSHNICVVGDDAQSIYSFRGARIENILNFKNDYPEMKLFKLEQNYRSTQNIVNAANSIISRNSGQIQKTVYSKNEEGDKVRIVSAYSDIEESEMICKDIALRMLQEHLQPSDFAILYRTNAQSRAFEEKMRKNGFKYKIFGGQAFYQRKEIKDVLAYFRLSVNHADSESLRRIINYPARAIGQTTLQKIEQIAQSNGILLWEALEPSILSKSEFNNTTITRISNFVALINNFTSQSQSLNAYEFAAEVISQSGIMKELTENKNDVDGKERLENVNEMLSGIKEFVDARLETDEDASIRAYLEDVALITDLDSDQKDSKDYITLMTIHSSKGLEFNHVYIVGVEEDIFPGQQSGTNPIMLEEERRLFYVALTRAKISVTVSYALSRYQYGNRTPSRQSRFIADIDEQYISRPETMNVASAQTSFRFPSSHNTATSFHITRTTDAKAHNTMFSRKPVAVNQSSESTSSMSKTEGTSVTYKVGDNVVHETFGIGTILAIEGVGQSTKLRVEFKHGGIKHLLLKFARLKPL